MNNEKNNEIKMKNKDTEEEFLSTYDISKYDRPSVTTDIAVFSMFAEETENRRKDSEPKLHVLLVRRGKHPFKGMWALPGGFLRPTETMEECALREIKEETNALPVALLPIGTFSKPDRDPRGRIISNAYASIVNAEDVIALGGTDVTDARWFEVSLFRDVHEPDDVFTLTLETREDHIMAELRLVESKFGNSKFEIISNDGFYYKNDEYSSYNGLAFDHAKIIAAALSTIRKEAENYTITFDFLPEKFTLTAFQKVQETLMGIQESILGVSLLTANFRRKTADLVEETDEYTEGAGHRPARLYRKKVNI